MVDISDSKSSHRVYLIVFSNFVKEAAYGVKQDHRKSLAYLYSFTNDAAISWSSPVLPQLRLNDTQLNPLGRRITMEEESWLGSLLSLGNMVGLLPYGYLCYKFGRKYTLTSLGVLHLIAFVLLTTNNLTSFYIGRFLNGVASGAGFVIFPMYIAEICKDSDRGFLLVSRQIFSSCGILFSYTAGNYLPLFWFNVILCIFPILYLISFTLLATESPYFYVMKDDCTTARNIFVQLTSINNEQTDEEVDEIRKAVEMSQTQNLTETLAHKPIQKAVILVYVLFIFQHLTGYMPFATYTEIIIQKTHGLDPKISTIAIGVIFLIGSTVSTFFIDKQGRKLLLYVSLTGVIIVELIFSSYYLLFQSFKLLPVICLSAFFLLFNVGLAFLPQIICAEILPISIKFKIASTAGVFGCGTAFLLTKSFLDINRYVGIGWTILGFAICSVVYLVIIALFLPETKGRSFRQIQSLLEVGLEMK